MDREDLNYILSLHTIPKEKYVVFAEDMYAAEDKEEIFELYKFRMSKHKSDISDAERALLETVYTDVTKQLQDKVVSLQNKVQTLDAVEDRDEIRFLENYVRKVKEGFPNICRQYCGVLESLASSSKDQELIISYLGREAEVHLDAARTTPLQGERRFFHSAAHGNYKKSKHIADSALKDTLKATDYVWLKMMGDYSAFQFDTLKSPDDGRLTAKEGVRKAKKELKENPGDLPENSKQAYERLAELKARR